MAVDPASLTMAQTIGVLVEGQRQHSERMDRMDVRMDRMDVRMDRIEAKLDRLIWLVIGVLGATLATFATTLIGSA